MMCIALRGEQGNEYWQGYRSVEILSYHPDDNNPSKGRINILFSVFLQNLLECNYLRILHPGNVSHKLIEAPDYFPRHQDEPIDKPEISGILESVYNKAFSPKGDKLLHSNCLSAWDSWYPNGEVEEVTIWPSGDTGHCKMKEVHAVDDKNKFVPFTEFRLGPFTKEGPVLLSFQMWFEGETYEKLVGNADVFTVDGPESLILRIKRDYISSMPAEDREKWENRIQKFDQVLSFGESYDVILMNPPYSSGITCVWKSGIVEGPYQPSDNVAKRYITAYPRFVLALKYAKAPVTSNNIAPTKII
jgi:hypothetical protein